MGHQVTWIAQRLGIDVCVLFIWNRASLTRIALFTTSNEPTFIWNQAVYNEFRFTSKHKDYLSALMVPWRTFNIHLIFTLHNTFFTVGRVLQIIKVFQAETRVFWELITEKLFGEPEMVLLWYCWETPLLEALIFRVLDSASTAERSVYINSLTQYAHTHSYKEHLLPPMLRNHRPTIVRTSCNRKKRKKRREKRGRRKGNFRRGKKSSASRNSTLARLIGAFSQEIMSVSLSLGRKAVVCLFVLSLLYPPPPPPLPST